MNREIKFRAWDVDKKIWLTEDETYKQVENQARWNPELGGHFVLMQFTGLTDKNSKEIYEGDIVRILYTDWASKAEDDPRTLEQYLIEDKCMVGKIVYNAPKFEISFGIGKYGDEDFGNTNHGTHGWIEVIGNIYENPELLKEKKTALIEKNIDK